jgi:hypothetical protein
MFFSNGTSKEFVIRSKKETFKYKKRLYLLRRQDICFNTTHNLYKLYFHEDIFVPINAQKVQQVEKDTDDLGTPLSQDDPRRRAWFNVTPHNAEEFFNMEYVKVLAAAVQLTKYIKLVLLIVLIALILVIAGDVIGYKVLDGLKHIGTAAITKK